MGAENERDTYAVVAEFYDYIVPYRDRLDVDFYVELAKESGGPVLEVGCGTGRVLLPTARAGIEIVGLDVSKGMLGVCGEKLSKEPEDVRARVELVEADMRTFDLGRKFALVTTPFRSFQHMLEVEDQLACLENIHRHLADNGRFVLDVFDPDISRLSDDKRMTEWEVEPEFEMPDGRKVVRRARITSRDLSKQVQEVELSHLVNHPYGHEEELSQRFFMRHFFRFEAEHLLARCGFKAEHLYANYEKAPYGSVNPGELLFVARKV